MLEHPLQDYRLYGRVQTLDVSNVCEVQYTVLCCPPRWCIVLCRSCLPGFFPQQKGHCVLMFTANMVIVKTLGRAYTYQRSCLLSV
jgi:hypothetical protein